MRNVRTPRGGIFFDSHCTSQMTDSRQTATDAGTHVIKRLMVNYDTLRQYLNFNWTDFLYYTLYINGIFSKINDYANRKIMLPITVNWSLIIRYSK